MTGGAAVAAALLALSAGPATAHAPIAFEAPWDAASAESLRRHGDAIGAVVPAWISVTGPHHDVMVAADPAGRAVLAALAHPPPLWIMVQDASLGRWDGANLAALLSDDAATAALLDRIEQEVMAAHGVGLVIDFEGLPANAQGDLARFLTAAHARTQAHGWTLAITVPVADPDWRIADLGRIADRVIAMAYDQHWQTGTAGPIAADDWFAAAIARIAAQVPRGRLVAAIASYAYDWPANGPATILSIAQAQALAAATGTAAAIDPASGNATFRYIAADGIAHSVWLMTAAPVAVQRRAALAAGARDIALWRLGTEDAAIWAAPAHRRESVRPNSAVSQAIAWRNRAGS